MDVQVHAALIDKKPPKQPGPLKRHPDAENTNFGMMQTGMTLMINVVNLGT
jgi:hypothetical protein